ncbi:cobaltochelatase subunit CobN, partial [Pseudomonas sp. PCH446]
CDLKESQIRDGLHVFGESPAGRLRIDTLLALLRIPRGDGRGASPACCGPWPGPSNWASIRWIAPGRTLDRAST